MKKLLLLSLTFVLILTVNAQVNTPENLKGNWFRSDNAQWEISLLDSVAIYKGNVWEYEDCNIKEGSGTIRLKNGNVKLTLYTKQERDGICTIGEAPGKMIKYTNVQDESLIPVDNEEFRAPVFKMDTAVYCGYYKGFNDQYPQKIWMVYVNDVLAGEQVPYSFTVSKSGYFEVKIPHANPQIVTIRDPLNKSETVFIEPGKRVFQLIDKSSTTQRKLFMGEGARVNADLERLKEVFSFNSGEILKKSMDFTPEQRKLYFENSLRKDLNQLKEFSQAHRICDKAEKLQTIALNHRSSMLNFQMNYLSDKMQNAKIQDTVKSDVPDIKNYSLLMTEFVNDPFSVMTSEYIFIINNMRKYLALLNMDQSAEGRNKELTRLFGIQPGFVIDIMTSQDICKPMTSKMMPVPEEKLQYELKEILDPFIANYVRIKNEDLKKKNELSRLAAKTKNGQLVRKVPETAGDKMFEAILDNYKGKVVFVDFWATWCAPCRSGIQKMKPLKEELTKENVVFVYITNYSSPQQIYDDMIPGIKGEHYRLKPDEFNTLTDRFKFSGIPHYMLVGKDGKIINENFRYTENEELKNLLMKYIKE